MNDELDHEEELEQESLVTTEPVDRDSHVAVIHDSFGERYVNVVLMLERAPTGPGKKLPRGSGRPGGCSNVFWPASSIFGTCRKSSFSTTTPLTMEQK